MTSHVRWLCLVLLTTLPLAAQNTPSLDAQLHATAAAHHGQVALFAEDLATHQTAALNPDTVVQTASVIKLAVLFEALEQVRAGKVAFTDKLTLTKPEQVPGSGILRLLDAPLQLTFKDVLTLMIILSDNTSTNLAIDHLGLANINQRIATLGLKNTYFYKKVFTPVAPGTILPADQKRFGLGKTTPREMAALMTKIIRCELATPEIPAQPSDPALCEVAIDMLHLQFYRTSIPRYLDGLPGATSESIANKTGSLDAVRNDVAAISSKHGMIVISAFTYDNADHSWGADHEAELTIAKLARAIVSAWSPDGLTAWPAPASTVLPASK
jgi:beta-lactamase class A